LQNVLIRSNAGVCPNDGMLRWNASASGANKWQCGALGTSQTVTNATNASPIAITVTAHGYSTGNRVSLSEVQGNTAANGEWTITVIDANTFTLNGSTGNNNFISGVGTPAAAQLVSFCLSGCLSKPQLVVWGRAQAAVPQEPPRVPSAVRHRGSLPAVLGQVPVTGWVRVPALRA
jgi:hypothetical protein